MLTMTSLRYSYNQGQKSELLLVQFHIQYSSNNNLNINNFKKNICAIFIRPLKVNVKVLLLKNQICL